MKKIICGSRKYKNINFDNLVDSFDVIVRNNMLLPNNNYGTKNSHIQVLNCHIYQYYSYDLNKQFSNKDGTGICHNIDFEIDIIKQLHKTGLIDATFCAIKDSSSLEIDSSLIDPTPAALDILSKIYKDIEKG
jgi:hypothetical protein